MKGQKTGGRRKGTPNRKTAVIRRALERADDLTAERTLEEYRCLGFSDVGELFDEQGRLRPLTELPRHVRAAIASVKVTKKNLTAGDGVMEDVVEVKLWDKTRALQDLAKHFGLIREKHDINIEVNMMLARLDAGRLRAAGLLTE